MSKISTDTAKTCHETNSNLTKQLIYYETNKVRNIHFVNLLIWVMKIKNI